MMERRHFLGSGVGALVTGLASRSVWEKEEGFPVSPISHCTFSGELWEKYKGFVGTKVNGWEVWTFTGLIPAQGSSDLHGSWGIAKKEGGEWRFARCFLRGQKVLEYKPGDVFELPSPAPTWEHLRTEAGREQLRFWTGAALMKLLHWAGEH